jgi:hypothetical protein
MYFTGFDCLGCRAAYPPDQDLLLCPKCHDLLEARYDLARFGREVDRDALAAGLPGSGAGRSCSRCWTRPAS